MSSNDTYIGDNPATGNSKLFFHQYLIYDNLNWTSDGYLCWDATNQCFYVQPFPQIPQINPRMTQAPKLQKKNLNN